MLANKNTVTYLYYMRQLLKIGIPKYQSIFRTKNDHVDELNAWIGICDFFFGLWNFRNVVILRNINVFV